MDTKKQNQRNIPKSISIKIAIKQINQGNRMRLLDLTLRPINLNKSHNGGAWQLTKIR